MLSRGGADGYRCYARAGCQGEDLSHALWRAKEMSALQCNQREMAADGNRCGCAALSARCAERSHQGARTTRTKRVAHPHWNVARGQGDQCAWMEYFGSEPC